MFTAATPLKVLHIVYVYIYALLYLIWSLIYWAIDHTNVIYPIILDWNKPDVTILFSLFLAFICVPISHGLMYGGYQLRCLIARRCMPDVGLEVTGVGYYA